MIAQQELPMAKPPPSETIVINAHCLVRAEGGQRLVVVAGLPVHHYAVEDEVAEAYAMVFLVDGGHASRVEVARAFGRSERTVRRHLERYSTGGMAALATRSGWRAGRRRLASRRRHVVERLKAASLSNREIARRLGVDEKAIRKQVGPSERTGRQEPLPFPEASLDVASPRRVEASTPQEPPASAPAATGLEGSEPPVPVGEAEDASTMEPDRIALCLDVDPGNRFFDRLLAAFGLLDDAKPVFGNAKAVPGAAVLCAVPALVASGIFRVAQKVYGEIGPAFYGLRTTLLTLLLMALWRIKRPEALKEQDPQTLGRVLGLDRAPEVKTVRRKLTRLASYRRAEELGSELARLRVQARGQLMGFLYVDGHVRVYHGKRKIPKAHVARMRLSMPATTDYWVNDQVGDPLFVMTAPVNAGMVKMLPEVLAEVRKLVGDRHVTIVFDRGGWSPKLFLQLIKDHFGILTYRKGRSRGINPRRFVLRRAEIDGRKVEYRLHDQAALFLNRKLRLRQVTRLSDDGHQTQVITTQWNLSDIEVAYRMFERWRQENFFKYLREEFLIDALADYKLEADDPTRTVPNPQRRALDKEIRAARAEVAKLEQTYGAAAVDNPEGRRPTMRGFKIAHGKIGKQLRAARDTLGGLVARRRSLPQRVPVRDVSDDAVVKLATERKHLTNIIKMLAYQAESDLLAFLAPHYARVEDEGRTLLHELLRAAADIDVTETELRVTVSALSSPHRTLAVQSLCETLTETATPFPGTTLTMRFAIRPRPELSLAFPGPRPRPPDAAAAQPTA